MTFAQSEPMRVIEGAVIDETGNPIPGALVQTKKGAQSVLSDADGTYSLEVPRSTGKLEVSYPGLKNKKKSIKKYDYVLFEMNKARPKMHWFVNAVGAVVTPLNDDNNSAQGQIGVMGGWIRKNWGMYLKSTFRVGGAQPGNGLMDPPFKGYKSYPGLTVGFIKTIGSRFSYLMGLGVVPTYVNHEVHNDFGNHGEENFMCYHTGVAWIIEAGFMARVTQNIQVMLGAGWATPSYPSCDRHYREPIYWYSNNEPTDYGNLSIFFGAGWIFGY